MHQRRFGLEQARHRQAFAMHLLDEVLNGGPRMHAVRPQKRKFGRFLDRNLTVSHRGEGAGRFTKSSAGLHGVGRGAKIQMLSRRLTLSRHTR